MEKRKREERIGIPPLQELMQNSYLEFYADIINAMSDDFEEEELITCIVNQSENCEIHYQFLITGLRRLVLTELLDDLNYVHFLRLHESLRNSSKHLENSEINTLVTTIEKVNKVWTEETKYNHKNL